MKIPKKIEAVIFDMDGLLIDSESMWFDTHTEFLNRRNIAYTDVLRKQVTGMGQKEIMALYKEYFDISDKWENMITEFRDIFYELSKNIRPMRGAKVLIKKLSKKGYQLAIATGGHAKHKTNAVLEDLQLKEYFSVVVSGDEVNNGKPNPDIFILAANKMNMNPKDCLVLEDAVNGVQAGKAAGMMVYGVNTEMYFQKELKKAGADKVFNYLSEITV